VPRPPDLVGPIGWAAPPEGSDPERTPDTRQAPPAVAL